MSEPIKPTTIAGIRIEITIEQAGQYGSTMFHSERLERRGGWTLQKAIQLLDVLSRDVWSNANSKLCEAAEADLKHE